MRRRVCELWVSSVCAISHVTTGASTAGVACVSYCLVLQAVLIEE
ncbi:unnamed protein product [Ectocarpus sp. 6 AP-2014]